MTLHDSLGLVSYLIDLVSAEFVPERSTDPPPFPRYTTLTQVKDRIDQDKMYSRFFVLSPFWERHPLIFHEIHANDGQHFFSVAQRYGGPAFDFIWVQLHTIRRFRPLSPWSTSSVVVSVDR
jgi:hypothetical protein